jgi:cytochrome c1
LTRIREIISLRSVAGKNGKKRVNFTNIHTTTPLMKLPILAALLATASLSASDISDVMKSSMKGETSLYNQVAKGKGSPADAQRLADSVKKLEGTKPPKGDQAAWDRKVAALIKAAEAATKGGTQPALMALQTAGNCKACHSGHKED